MQLRRWGFDKGPIERGLSALVWDGVFSQALGILTGGALLTGCALEFGASPAFIGLLAAIPFFAQLAHIPAVALIEKVRRRRAICLAATIAARLMLLPLAAVPFIADRDHALPLLAGAFVLFSPLAAVGGCAWMSWTCDLVPHHRLGDVFAGRQLRSNISAIVAGLLGGAIVNGWSHAFPAWHVGGYAGVFGLALAAAAASTWCLARMPDVPMPPPCRTSLLALFAKPFRDANFRRVMTFLAGWQFVANLVLPLYPVYFVEQLHYSVGAAIMLAILSQLASVVAVSFWGRLCDRTSNRTVIALCAPLFLCCPFGWVLAAVPASPALGLAMLLLLQLVLGVAMAGLDLAGGNIALKLAQRSEATVFLGANGLVKSLCAGFAPMMGGLIVERLSSLPSGASAVQPWPAFFIATGLLGIVALLRLTRIEEAGHVPLGALLAAVRKGFGAACHATYRRYAGAADRMARGIMTQATSRLSAPEHGDMAAITLELTRRRAGEPERPPFVAARVVGAAAAHFAAEIDILATAGGDLPAPGAAAPTLDPAP